MQTLAAAATAPTLSLDLDDLLQESVKQVEDQKAAKLLNSRIRSGRASKAEQAMSTQVELKANWRPVANCEMWDQTVCECGHTHATFTQYMQEFAPLHSGVSLSHRWMKVEPQEVKDGLPNKAIYNVKEVFHCSECSNPPEGAEIIIWVNSQPSMAKEFEQEPDTQEEGEEAEGDEDTGPESVFGEEQPA